MPNETTLTLKLVREERAFKRKGMKVGRNESMRVNVCYRELSKGIYSFPLFGSGLRPWALRLMGVVSPFGEWKEL